MNLLFAGRVRSYYIKLPLCRVLLLLSGVQICTRCLAVRTNAQPVNASVEVTPASFNSSMQTTAPTNSSSTPGLPTVEASYRLPISVRPLHYDLELQMYINYTNAGNFTFTGSVRILVRCHNSTDNITLNVDKLTVDNTSIRVEPETPSASTDPAYISHEQDLKRQFFIINLDNTMEPGKSYWLEMTFSGRIGNNLFGIYSSKYNRNGEKAYIVTTQFESSYARRAFPCFDEPAMKATFNITLVRPADRVSLSNMPQIDSNTTFEENGTTYVKDVYSQTPLMSTYLLAFVVCDFPYLEARTKDNVTQFRTWAPTEHLNATRYTLDVAVKVHEFLEEYFDIKYPLPKQDMIAVADYAHGAMENWGLITYSEESMLYREGVTLEQNYGQVYKTVAHEVAHMWAGNIVTPEWWDDLWLKEAFAAYFEYLAMEQVHPEWRAFEYYISDVLHSAFTLDGKTDSKVLYEDVETPSQILNIAHQIVYVKGSSIVRMLKFVIGDSTFRQGYMNFLKKRLYSTARRDDLYKDMMEEAKSDGLDINVKEFVDPWVLQRNLPVVTVTQNLYNNSILHVAQERFLDDPLENYNDTSGSAFNYLWTIPLTLASSNYSVFNQTGQDVYWLNKEEHAKTLHVNIPLPDSADPNGWVLVNLHQYGYYRVNYEVSNWLALSRQLKRNHSVIPVNNRAQIINDACSLANANYTSMQAALATLEYLHNERDYSPWHAARTEINNIATKLESTPLHTPFKKFMQGQLTAPFQHFGLENITTRHIDKLTQILLAKMACDFHVQACLDQARSVYNSLVASAGLQEFDPDFKDIILCHGVSAGGLQEWENALEMFKRAATSDEKYQMVSVLACSRDKPILNRYLNLILHENETIFTWEAYYVVYYVINQEDGRDVAWNFYRNNFEELRSTSPDFGCDEYISHLVIHFNTELKLNEVQDFISEYCPSFNQALLEESIVKPIQKNIDWLKKHSSSIQKWLVQNGLIKL